MYHTEKRYVIKKVYKQLWPPRRNKLCANTNIIFQGVNILGPRISWASVQDEQENPGQVAYIFLKTLFFRTVLESQQN